MNPVTLTADILRAARIAAQPPFLLNRCENQPLLTYTFVGRGVGNTLMDHGPKRLEAPFPFFRYWLSHDGVECYGACRKGIDLYRGVGVFADNFKHKVIIYWSISLPLGRANKLTWSVYDYEKGEPVNPTPSMSTAAGLMADYVRALAIEYVRADHIARVTPDKPGKSVTWKQAREHYTIIHRRHAANSPRVAAGAVVEQDEAAHLNRLAHSRRAHERLYKHERFTKARGTTIVVKASWCGPKEWRDTAGQIYQIVEHP